MLFPTLHKSFHTNHLELLRQGLLGEKTEAPVLLVLVVWFCSLSLNFMHHCSWSRFVRAVRRRAQTFFHRRDTKALWPFASWRLCGKIIAHYHLASYSPTHSLIPPAFALGQCSVGQAFLITHCFHCSFRLFTGFINAALIAW